MRLHVRHLIYGLFAGVCLAFVFFDVFQFSSVRFFNKKNYPKRHQNDDALFNEHGTVAEVRAALYKDVYNLSGRFSDLNISDDLMSKAIHPGNPIRLKNILRKTLRGADIKLAVLGGSNSAGGQLGEDEKSLEGLYFKVFTFWWNKTIAKLTTAFVKELQLAIGATGSYFYAYCYNTFVGEDENIDIVLIEVSVNDENHVKPLEQLTRQVLTLPSAPAVFYINLVSHVGLRNPSCSNLENFGQVELARHYGIASLSLREVLCREEKGKWSAVITNMTASDGHIDGNAHALVGIMMIKYVRSVFKELIEDISKGVDRVKENKDNNLPKLLFVKSETEALKKPLCWTGKTPDINKHLHRPNLQFRVIKNQGFSPCLLPKSDLKPLHPDAEGGWCAQKRLSTLTVSLVVPSLNFSDVSLRSVTVMILSIGGQATVWFDNKKNQAVKFDRSYGYSQFDTVAARVKPGHHNLTFTTARQGLLVVSGVFVGPPDFQLRFP